jgi:hypothetical protein
MQQILDDPRRHVIFPSSTDRERIDAVFQSVIDGWTARDSRNGLLLSKVREEVAELRATR